MFKLMAVVAMVALSVGLGGCIAPQEELGASVQAVLGNDFTGNFVKIHGVRAPGADRKYPCISEFEVCLGLDPAGATAAIRDLCPSDDTPEGTWSFTYVIYADAACTQTLANLGCVPTMQEWLHPGANDNDVVCITRNAEKSFDFCVMDPVTGAGSEACPPCIPPDALPNCNPT